MAKIFWQLNIEFSTEAGENACGWLRSGSSTLREKVEALGYVAEPKAQGTYFLCKVSELESSQRLADLRKAIYEAGYRECEATFIPVQKRNDTFSFKKLRMLSTADINQARWLLLSGKGIQKIADWHATDESGYVFRANKRLKNSLGFGWADLVNVPLVSEEGMNALKDGELVGLEFEPVRYDNPSAASRQLYLLTSSVKLPGCLLPLKNREGKRVSAPDEPGGKYWDDGGYMPPFLKYQKDEIDAMPAFDLGLTHERIGGLKQYEHHQYIVSQRFREHLEAMKVRSVDFIPVELVDEDFEG